MSGDELAKTGSIDSSSLQRQDFNQSMLDWCEGLHLWAQKAVVRYFEDQIPSVLDLSKELSEWVTTELDGVKKMPGKISASAFTQQYSLTPVRYLSISDVKGVNAIETTSDQPLLFEKNGLTLVYGMNGSGKSGYMRIFKKIAGRTSEEEILGNIYRGKKESPSCTIATWDGSTETETVCMLNEHNDSFPLIDVFDGRSSSEFIQDGKDLTYVPRIIGLFSFLSDTADTLKQRANDNINSIQNSMPQIAVPEVSQSTTLGKKLISLDSKTLILDEESSWDPADQQKLERLNDFIGAGNKEVELKLIGSQVKQMETLLSYLRPIAASNSDENTEKINSLKAEYLLRKKRRDEASLFLQSVADPIDQVDLAQDSWKAMWQAVHSYTEEGIDESAKVVMSQGAVCPLCHQEISEPQVKRMTAIDEYVCGQLAKEADEKRQALEQSAADFSPVYIESIRVAASDIKPIIGEELHNSLFEVLDEMDLLYSSLISDDDYVVPKTRIVEVGKALRKRKEELSEKEKLFKSGMESKQYKEALSNHAELTTQKFCHENINKIAKIIESQKRIERQKNAIKLFNTNKYTIKANEVAKTVITEPYIDAFNNELSAFKGTRNIKVELEPRSSGKGRIGHRVVLKSVEGFEIAANNVLSDGEMRVVSLAAFLAESAQKNQAGVMVFDDPISSLDLEYESEFSARVVEMAKSNQVIIFSHRLSLMYELNSLCKQNSVAYSENHLYKTVQQVAGVPVLGDVRTMKLKSALSVLINESIPRIKKMDDTLPEYTTAITGTVGEFRVLIERGIEETLLYGVITRYNRNVSSQKIKCLSGISEDDCDFLDTLMSKYSTPIHSQSSESPWQRYSIDEIETDVGELIEWNTKVAKRNEAVSRAS